MLKELTLEQFAGAVASQEAVPGGGSVSALAGALAACLAAMVAQLTLKKEKFAEVAPQMKTLERSARELQGRLLAAVDRDADSYRRVLSAICLPKGTNEEKTARGNAIQAAFQSAAQVPLEVADFALQVMDLAAQALRHGNPGMITDAGVGLLLARSAALGALMNVRINLTGLKDEAIKADMGAAIDRLKKEVLKKERTWMVLLPL